MKFKVIAASAGIAAGTLTLAPVALADPPNDVVGCAQGTVCFWEGPDFTGSMKTIFPNPADGDIGFSSLNQVDPVTKFPDDTSLNDHIGSVDNQTSRHIDFFPEAGFTGVGFQLAPGQSRDELGDLTDRISSFHISPSDRGNKDPIFVPGIGIG